MLALISHSSAVLRESLAAVTSVVPSLASQIITILTKRCAEHLKLVKFVASQVRASTRKGPHEPSYFIPNVLKELRAYLIGPGKVVEEELRIKWATAVVEDVAARYAVPHPFVFATLNDTTSAGTPPSSPRKRRRRTVFSVFRSVSKA